VKEGGPKQEQGIPSGGRGRRHTGKAIGLERGRMSEKPGEKRKSSIAGNGKNKKGQGTYRLHFLKPALGEARGGRRNAITSRANRLAKEKEKGASKTRSSNNPSVLSQITIHPTIWLESQHHTEGR